MGFHVCEYCSGGEKGSQFKNTSSGDVVLVFDSGRIWQMPDMILHYVADHSWKPPDEFIEDVMHGQFSGGERFQTKGIPTPVSIAYLSGFFEKGSVPTGFLERLKSLMEQADQGRGGIRWLTLG